MIKLDARERALLAELPGCETSSLPAGDVDIGGGFVVLERKRVDDLAASIRDGRWRDQLARLRACPRAALVVEGALPPDDSEANGVSGRSLRSALAGAFVRDGIGHFRTSGAAETAALVRALSDRVGRGEGPSEQTACGVRLPRRSDALRDSRAVAVSQLCAVPGASRDVADTVLGGCETIGAWLALWSGRRDELAEVRVKSRRLGPVLAERLLRVCGADSVRPSDRCDRPGPSDRPGPPGPGFPG